jgi:hypothetical protein
MFGQYSSRQRLLILSIYKILSFAETGICTNVFSLQEGHLTSNNEPVSIFLLFYRIRLVPSNSRPNSPVSHFKDLNRASDSQSVISWS